MSVTLILEYLLLIANVFQHRDLKAVQAEAMYEFNKEHGKIECDLRFKHHSLLYDTLENLMDSSQAAQVIFNILINKKFTKK